MKSERLFRVLGLIDEDLIEEANTPLPSVSPRRHTYWKHALAAAACLALICTVTLPLLRSGGSTDAAMESIWDTTESAAPEEPGGQTGGSGIATDSEPLGTEGTTFMSYAGPVFPLTLEKPVDGLTVERKTTWNFAPNAYQDGTPRQWGAGVTDSYLLTNSTTGEILAMACYPMAGSAASLAEQRPAVTADDQPVDWTLYAGSYAGNFTHAGVDDGSTWNLQSPDSWMDYKTLLEDGTYYENAKAPYPSLDTPVTVYSFTDYQAPGGYNAAVQAIDFTIDPEKTQILSYGFNGLWSEDDGWRRYDFFVPSALRHGDTLKMLIVLGDDIDGYTLQGYENGSCETALPGVSCTMTRQETTLDQALNALCQVQMDDYRADFEGDSSTEAVGLFDLISEDVCQGLMTQLLVQHGIFAGDNAKDRYTDGRLDDIFWEALHQERVLYLTFPVTIPANSSVEITAELWKEPSYDFGCSGSEHVGLQGYDLSTTLGSCLQFTKQSAALINTDTIEVFRQNFGFDLENGVTDVQLDPAQAHYYLEIREKQADTDTP